MALVDYVGLIPEYENFRFADMLWPSHADRGYPIYEAPPFSLSTRGTDTTIPAVLTAGTASITAYRDMGPSGGYPAAPAQRPKCGQVLPLANWQGGYVPYGTSFLDWVKQNPVEAILIGMLTVGVGGWIGTKL